MSAAPKYLLESSARPEIRLKCFAHPGRRRPQVYVIRTYAPFLYGPHPLNELSALFFDPAGADAIRITGVRNRREAYR